MLENLKTSDDIQQEKDVLGGGGVVDSGIAEFTIDHAFTEKSSGGALALTVRFSTPDGRRHDEQFWMTSGDAKGNKNYFLDRANQKQYLPGFTHANSLCLLTVGKEISELTTEEKTLKLYDFDAKKELPRKVNAIVDLFGKQIIAGVLRETHNKNVDSGKVDANNKKIYVASAETRDVNTIDKFFRARDGLTVPEIRAKSTEAEFKTKWATKNTGVTRDKRENKTGAVGGTSGSAGVATAAKPAKSLFED